MRLWGLLLDDAAATTEPKPPVTPAQYMGKASSGRLVRDAQPACAKKARNLRVRK